LTAGKLAAKMNRPLVQAEVRLPGGFCYSTIRNAIP